MANSFRPDFKGRSSSPAFRQIRGTAEDYNPNSNALDLNYPILFVGAVIIAVIMFYIRERDRNTVTGVGLVTVPTTVATTQAQIDTANNTLNYQYHVLSSQVLPTV